MFPPCWTGSSHTLKVYRPTLYIFMIMFFFNFVHLYKPVSSTRQKIFFIMPPSNSDVRTNKTLSHSFRLSIIQPYRRMVGLNCLVMKNATVYFSYEI